MKRKKQIKCNFVLFFFIANTYTHTQNKMGCNLSTFFSNTDAVPDIVNAPCVLKFKLYNDVLEKDHRLTAENDRATIFRNEQILFNFYIRQSCAADDEPKLELCGHAYNMMRHTEYLHCWTFVYLTLMPANGALGKWDKGNNKIKEAKEISMVFHFQGKEMQWTTLDIFPSIQYLCDVRNGYMANTRKAKDEFLILQFQISIQEKPFDLSVMPQPSDVFTEHYILK